MPLRPECHPQVVLKYSANIVHITGMRYIERYDVTMEVGPTAHLFTHSI